MRIDAYMQVNQMYQTSKSRTTAKTSKTEVTDSFEVSAHGRALQVAKKAVSETADVREEKIQDIMNRMKAGTYNVSIEDVADKLTDRLLG